MEKKSKKNTITLEPPPDNSSFESFFYGLEIVGVSLRGDRDSNEDVEIVQPINTSVSESPMLLAGVLDGHGGYEASVYCAEEVIKSFSEQLKLWPNIPKMFTHAFKSTHKHFARYFPKSEAGTTATFALVQHNTIHIANCGDSRAIVVYYDGVQQISIDHSPSSPEEKNRIVAMGGAVTNIGGVSRVFGILSVSRALGDILLKPYISELPDVFELSESKDIAAIVIGCDGLFYGLSNEEIATGLRDGLRSGLDIKEAALRISKMSIDRKCYDNVSCVVIVPPGGIEALKNEAPRTVAHFAEHSSREHSFVKYTHRTVE